MDASYLFAKNFFDVKYEDLPSKVVDETKKQILDYIGVVIAGYEQEGAKQTRELAIEWGGAPQATIICSGEKVPAPNAAQVNASTGHALDFDDVHEAAVMHPGIVTISTALAVAEYKNGLSGRDLIQAVAVGGDMMCRMGLATHPGEDIHKFGWHFTAVNGFMTSAAVAAKIMGLDEEKMISAIGIAYHQASGNGQSISDGVLTKRLGPGFAARGGIAAAMMAERGVSGARNSLEGVKGYYFVYHGNDYSRDILVGDLGERFESANTSIKPYPCCRGTHPTIDGALKLVREYGVTADNVERIVIYCGMGTRKLLAEPFEFKSKPRNLVDSQFSLIWGCAAAIAKGRVTLSCYCLDALDDKEILDVASKVGIEHDPKYDTGGLEPMRMELHTKDGKTHTVEMLSATGSPECPMSFEECVDKFNGCIEEAPRPMPKENAEKVIEMIKDLENLSDIRELIKQIAW